MTRLLGSLIGLLFGNERRLVKKFGFGARSLTAFERAEASMIFGDKLNYDRVRIFEGANLPNFIDDIGRWIKRMPKREVNVKNAITLGNNCLFGRQLKTDEITDMDTKLDSGQLIEMSWLIHELTHAFQYQTLGWKYLYMALEAQGKLGARVYDFGGVEGLKKRQKSKGMIKEFNMEQQGHLVQKYYEAIKRGEDASVYEPFVKQILS